MKAKGFVAIVVLWMISFFGIASLILAQRVQSQISVIRRFEGAARQRLETTAGVSIVMDFIQNPQNWSEEDLDWANAWLDHPEIFQSIPLSETSGVSVSVGYPSEENGEEFIYGLFDEQSKININFASENVLARLYQNAADLFEDPAKDLAKKTVEYRNRQEKFTEFGQGIGRSQGVGFGSVRELLLVGGMTEPVWQAIEGDLTVLGPGTLNLNTVSRQTLLHVGLPKGLVERIVEYRDQHRLAQSMTPNKKSLKAFENLGDVSAKIGMSVDEDTVLQNLSSLWTFESTVLRFQSILAGGTAPAAIGLECVVDKKGNILFYQET